MPTHKSTQTPTAIVGLGASAGGLSVLEAFFEAVPAKHQGLAFVVVQHLSPTSKSILVELVQRHTCMPVFQATHNLEVEAGHVYVRALFFC